MSIVVVVLIALLLGCEKTPYGPYQSSDIAFQQVAVPPEEVRTALIEGYGTRRASKPAVDSLHSQAFDYIEIRRELSSDSTGTIQCEFLWQGPDEKMARQGVLTLSYAKIMGEWQRQHDQTKVEEGDVIYGRVVVEVEGAVGGEKVQGARVYFRRPETTVLTSTVSETGTDGRATVALLRGTYKLVVAHNQYDEYVSSQTFEVRSGTSMFENPIRLVPRKTTPDRVMVRVQVVDLAGKAQGGVSVSAVPKDPAAVLGIPEASVTDATGYTSIMVVPGQVYDLKGFKSAGVTAPFELMVPESTSAEASTISLVLQNTSPQLFYAFRTGGTIVRPGEEVVIEVRVVDAESQAVDVSFKADHGDIDFERSGPRTLVWHAPLDAEIVSTILLTARDGYGGEDYVEVKITTARLVAGG